MEICHSCVARLAQEDSPVPPEAVKVLARIRARKLATTRTLSYIARRGYLPATPVFLFFARSGAVDHAQITRARATPRSPASPARAPPRPCASSPASETSLASRPRSGAPPGRPPPLPGGVARAARPGSRSTGVAAWANLSWQERQLC